MLIFIFYIII